MVPDRICPVLIRLAQEADIVSARRGVEGAA